MADALKAQGNKAFQAGQFEEAIKHFTDAINLDPSNHVLYSNRSASHASLSQYDDALQDAEKVVELKPDWGKGYSRLGAAHHGLQQLDEAVSAYEKGLTYDPQNAALKQSLSEAKQAQSRPQRGAPGNMFGPEFMAKLHMNPQTRPLLSQPDFVAMLQDMGKNPANMSKYLGDSRLQQALSVGLGINMMSGDNFKKEQGMNGAGASATTGQEEEEEDDDDDSMPDLEPAEPVAAAQAAPAKAAPAKASKPAEPEPESEEQREQRAKVQCKEQALKEKEQGNAAYKAKSFDVAIGHYDKAYELYDEDISFLTNRAAVQFEKGSYEECIADCDQAVERGRELRADYKLVAKAFTRKGNALVKTDKLPEAISVYHKALTEHRNADTLKRLQDTEKLLKERTEEAYVNLDLSNEEKEKGNQAFKEQKYPEAVKFYTEALARGPPKVNPDAHKLHSNRAACYTKLGAWDAGLKDADECIKLKPDFTKGYVRKGHLQFFMKEHEEAMKTYELGLSYDKDNQELKEGLMRCQQAINKFISGDASEEELAQRRARAMSDPEIQNIMTDPVMRQVLQDLQEDPRTAQKHMQQPQIRLKLDKLIKAGIVRMG